MSSRTAATIPTLVADDEAPALDELLYLLRSFPEIEVVGTATNGPEALERIEELEPDLVFIDVQMPGAGRAEPDPEAARAQGAGAGLRAVHGLRAVRAEAFRMEALDYLLKPVTRERGWR